MAFKRVNLLSILKKIGAEFTDKIPDERAVEKIKRIVAKKGLPDDAEWSRSEQKTLKKLKLLKKAKTEEAAPEEKASKKKGKKKSKKSKREGNVAKAKRLIEEGKSEKEIEKIFLADYKEQGKTDKDWCKKRVAIYIKIAKGGSTKKKSKKDKEEKPAKNKKKGDAEKSEKKSKGKKKAAKEEDSDDEDEEEDAD